MTETDDQPTYFRPVNAETGEPLLTVYFTAALFELGDAHLYDMDTKLADLSADARDHLHAIGLPIRPTIKQGRVRIMQETDPDAEGYNRPAVVRATVMAFLTEAEPDDARLRQLHDGFVGERTKVHVDFSIPTVESEAAEREAIAADEERGRQYFARASAEREAAAKEAGDPFGSDLSELFD